MTSSAQALPADIRYESQDPSCPNREQFLTDLRNELRANGASNHADPRLFTVRVGSNLGVLEIRDENGPTDAREFPSKSCIEAERAVALSAAFAITLPPAPPESAAPRPPPPPPPPPSWTWAVGIGGLVLIDYGPEPGFGAAAYVEQTPILPVTLGRHVRLSLAYAATLAPYSAAGARWQWFLSRLESCPLRFAATPAFYVRPCLDVTGGAIFSEGQDLNAPQQELRPWIAPGGGFRATWELGNLQLELGASISVPITSYNYTYTIRDKPGLPDGGTAPVKTLVESINLAIGYRLP